MREQEQRDAETKQLRHILWHREQEQRDAETKQGTWESKSSVMLRESKAHEKAKQCDAETIKQWESKSSVMLRQSKHTREQEQRDADQDKEALESVLMRAEFNDELPVPFDPLSDKSGDEQKWVGVCVIIVWYNQEYNYNNKSI